MYVDNSVKLLLFKSRHFNCFKYCISSGISFILLLCIYKCVNCVKYCISLGNSVKLL